MPETLTAPPPATPAPAAAPATPPAPSKTTPQPRTQHFEPSFRDLDKLIETPEPPPTTPEPPKPSGTAPTEAPEAPSTPPGKESAQKSGESPKTPPEKPEQHASASQLREQYEAQKAELAKIRQELAEAKASGASKTEIEELRKQVEAERKAKTELDDRLKVLDYRESSEYKDNYEKPLHDAFRKAWSEVTELTVTLPDGTTRIGTPEDFNSIMSKPLGEARKMAKEMFGEDYPAILDHIRVVRDKRDAANAAVDQAKQRVTTQKAAEAAQLTEAQKAGRARYETYQKALDEKYPDLYVPKQDDPKEAELVAAGDDLALKGLGWQKDLTREQFLDAAAEVSRRASRFGMLAHRNIKLSAQVKALEAELAGYRGSENPKPTPSGGPQKGSGKANRVDDVVNELDALPGRMVT